MPLQGVDSCSSLPIMGTKKKKTQLKPVARGFATTSVPKKVVSAVDAAVEDGSSQPNPNGSDAQGKEARPDTAKVEDVPGSNGNDIDPLLQNLVDKYQDRTEKDIVRTIKVCLWSPCLTTRRMTWCQGHRAGETFRRNHGLARTRHKSCPTGAKFTLRSTDFSRYTPNPSYYPLILMCSSWTHHRRIG